jgi:hypothetical protein
MGSAEQDPRHHRTAHSGTSGYAADVTRAAMLCNVMKKHTRHAASSCVSPYGVDLHTRWNDNPLHAAD